MPPFDAVVLRAQASFRAAAETLGCRVKLAGVHCIGPAEFWPQLPRRAVVGLWVFPSSGELLVTHRLHGTRTQTRQAVPAGSAILRGAMARARWSIAIPPVRQGVAPCDAMRRFMVFVEEQGEYSPDEASFHAFAPRAIRT